LALTRKVCSPTDSPVSSRGEVQELKPAESRAHSKVAPGSLEKVNVAAVPRVGADGPESIVVSGSVWSGGAWIVHG
jgi:hypothetical protein